MSPLDCHYNIKQLNMLTRFCTIRSIDHLVLTVASLDRTVYFYQRLGMQHITFGSPDKRHALLFGNNKINLHIAGAEFEPKAANVQTGSADLCFVVEDKLEDVLTRFREANVDVLEGGGIVARTGATGAISSVYVRDPDGNLIELSRYKNKDAARE